MKRIIVILLAAVLTLGCTSSLVSCGGNKPQKMKVEHVYRITTLRTENGSGSLSNIYTRNGKPCAAYYVYNEASGMSELVDYEIDTDKGTLTRTSVARPTLPSSSAQGYSTLSNSAICDDGSGWFTRTSYTTDPKTFEMTEATSLLRTDKSGKILFEKDVEAILAASGKKYDFNYINKLIPTEDGAIAVDYNSNLIILGSDGSVKKTIALNADVGTVQDVYLDGNEVRFVCTEYDLEKAKAYFHRVDLTSGKDDRTLLPAEQFDDTQTFFMGPGYSFYYKNETGIFGYDAASQKSVELMNFLNSDCTSNLAGVVTVLSPDRFLAYGHDEVLQEQAFSLLERIPDKQVREKYILTLAVLGDGYQASREAIRYNRTSSKYRVVIKEYNTDPAALDGGDAAAEKAAKANVDALNNDIIAGNPPDILYVNEYTPIDTYAAKGMIVDLYDYLKKEKRVTRKDLLENVLKAQETGGKLYKLSPTYSVRTFAAKTKNLNGMKTWKVDQFVKWARSLPEGASVFREMKRDDLLRVFLTLTHDDYIDSSTGRCSFDSAEFRSMLEYIATLPEKSAQEMQTDFDYEDIVALDDMFRNDKAMMVDVMVNSFSSISTISEYQFGTQDVTFIGLPVKSGTGGVIVGSATYSLFKKSKLKDGGWDFICYFQQKDYQMSAKYCFPIRKDALEELAQKALDDEARLAAQRESPVLAGDPQLVPLTREKVDETIAFIKSVNRTESTDLTVINIIREEAGPYFAGQKSLDDTIRIIQNRVSTFIAESR